jgi:hypothetical protein
MSAIYRHHESAKGRAVSKDSVNICKTSTVSNCWIVLENAANDYLLAEESSRFRLSGDSIVQRHLWQLRQWLGIFSQELYSGLKLPDTLLDLHEFQIEA